MQHALGVSRGLGGTAVSTWTCQREAAMVLSVAAAI